MSWTDLGDELRPPGEAEGRSLDLVQRLLISFLVGGVIGMIASVLAVYVATSASELPADSTIGLWVMTGVVGLAGAVVVLLLNRRKPYHPLVLIGLLPMLISGYVLFA